VGGTAGLRRKRGRIGDTIGCSPFDLAGLYATALPTLNGVLDVPALEITLRARYRPGNDPTNTGQLQITWPALTVTKAGFQTYRQELSGSP
jgi:hypothetical protein